MLAPVPALKVVQVLAGVPVLVLAGVLAPAPALKVVQVPVLPAVLLMLLK